MLIPAQLLPKPAYGLSKGVSLARAPATAGHGEALPRYACLRKQLLSVLGHGGCSSVSQICGSVLIPALHPWLDPCPHSAIPAAGVLL